MAGRVLGMTDTILGSVASGYEPVRDTFSSFFAREWDTGSAVSVYHRGKSVARLTGGTRIGGEDDRAYDEHTIQLVASTTKFAESLCIALLVDRGLLSYDDRIVDHWPAFADGGPTKALVTVRQLMMHRAGLPVFDRKLGDDELFDLDARARFLEQQVQVVSLFAPEPIDADWRGQRPAPPQAYHAVARGLYSSELLRRVDPVGRRLGTFY